MIHPLQSFTRSSSAFTCASTIKTSICFKVGPTTLVSLLIAISSQTWLIVPTHLYLAGTHEIADILNEYYDITEPVLMINNAKNIKFDSRF